MGAGAIRHSFGGAVLIVGIALAALGAALIVVAPAVSLVLWAAAYYTVKRAHPDEEGRLMGWLLLAAVGGCALRAAGY